VNLKGVVLVSDMDPMIPKVCEIFGMVHYWERCHVNQAIVCWAGEKHQKCVSTVIKYVDRLRECEDKTVAPTIVLKLQRLLNLKFKMGVKNISYCPDMWSYLEKTVLTDLNRICKWTVSHLSSNFWQWSQAIESQNNIDLNVWNYGKRNIPIEEAVYRYQQIDKAEI
jgi:hypothetical protein